MKDEEFFLFLVDDALMLFELAVFWLKFNVSLLLFFFGFRLIGCCVLALHNRDKKKKKKKQLLEKFLGLENAKNQKWKNQPKPVAFDFGVDVVFKLEELSAISLLSLLRIFLC